MDEKGDCSLYIACDRGQLEIVKLLLAHTRTNVNALADAGVTPFYIACARGHVKVVTLLLACDTIDVNAARTDDGVSPLHIACDQGWHEIVELLMAHTQTNVNAVRTADGATPLYIACDRGQLEIVKLLLAHTRTNVNALADAGATPFYIACARGHVKVVTLLLACAGIDVNKGVTEAGTTPMHAVSWFGDIRAVQLLAIYGARSAALDTTGSTPAQHAEAQNHPVLAQWLNAVAGWCQLRVAAGCRLHKDAALLLRQGRIDPDDPAATSIADMMIVKATSKTKVLPWENAAPICKTTSKLITDATCGWYRTTHWLHHKSVRTVVFTVLVVAGRLQKQGVRTQADTLLSEDAVGLNTAPPGAAVADDTGVCFEVLPIEIWFYAMKFFMRSWWIVS